MIKMCSPSINVPACIHPSQGGGAYSPSLTKEGFVVDTFDSSGREVDT